MNYTEETTKYIVSEYTKEPSRETVDALSQELGKTAKSIIGKLSKEGVYRREVYTTKLGDKPVTKLEIVAEISNALGINLEGLDKAPKRTLQSLQRRITSQPD